MYMYVRTGYTLPTACVQWQKQQVEAYCRKYNLTKVEYEFPQDPSSRHRLFRHLLTDDKRKILFAFVPKASYIVEQVVVIIPTMTVAFCKHSAFLVLVVHV